MMPAEAVPDATSTLLQEEKTECSWRLHFVQRRWVAVIPLKKEPAVSAVFPNLLVVSLGQKRKQIDILIR